MEYTYIAAISGLFLVVFFLVALWVRRSYMRFCEREDQKDRISVLRKEILSAKTYIRTTYSTPMDHSVADNLLPKIDFLLKLISNKSSNDQEREMRMLRDLLAETFVRLRGNYMDVQYVLSPLNTFRDRLVQEHLDWLREHMDGVEM